MAKTKILNSLIHSLAHSYFSTLNFCDGGYLSDWIVNSANELGISELKIDILNKRIYPKKMEIKPLMYHLDSLPPIIDKTLKSNDLETDFIVEAIFEISITDNRTMICDGFAKGKNDRIYKSKPYTEKSFQIFKVFDLTLQNKLAKWGSRKYGQIKFFLWRKYKIGNLGYTKRIENQIK